MCGKIINRKKYFYFIILLKSGTNHVIMFTELGNHTKSVDFLFNNLLIIYTLSVTTTIFESFILCIGW